MLFQFSPPLSSLNLISPAMNGLLIYPYSLCLLLLLLLHANSKAIHILPQDLEGEEREEFIKDCQTNSPCGGIDIRYPFRLINSTPMYCGVQGLEVSCSAAGDATIKLPRLGPCKIVHFDTDSVKIKLLGDEWAQCPLQKLSSIIPTGLFYHDYEHDNGYDYMLVNCSSETATDPEWITGPIPCLGNGSQGEWIYVAKLEASMDQLPSGCVSTGIGGNIEYYAGGPTFGDQVQGFNQMLQMDVSLNIPEWEMCRDCHEEGKQCGFSRRRNQTACLARRHETTNIGRIVEDLVGTFIGGLVVVGGLVVALTSLIILFILKKKSQKDEEIRFKVEHFLATYGDAQPTRYSFSDIRKITMRFKNKLGQGGYGSVYKGELSNGIPVAVKMLESSKGEGQEFINEVATIGRIHHINITRLLGFCTERSTRALIYEFMPNESLEKYIFSRQDKGSNKSLSMEKLLNIAIGIARGIEYLHQGCEQRILHFDIKPHNILLDYDLNPKISDFGLAKLCSRDISIVTMTVARGTMGYIAPEMYCRNFGTVSYKSDVYSFGMLLLEMIGGRKNHDPEIGRESEIYYPEWVYDRLVERQDLVMTMKMEQNDGEILQKLSKVALWCIQWSPTERPTMTRILHMLIGSSEEVHMPPKPFVSQHES
ncbi:rust resistance kinase Lr10-like [Zingiber officinale]|uniref:rust resistance kinase Lr10-like n=1 Tax=Zingiber officinale TaxID=94328 RepID=UPI001C4CBA32|nr:rust resistance kinase Lr10-like [Zingiber officinale]